MRPVVRQWEARGCVAPDGSVPGSVKAAANIDAVVSPKSRSMGLGGRERLLIKNDAG